MASAGAAVSEDVPDEVVVDGMPARIAKHGRHFPAQSAPTIDPRESARGSVRDTVTDVINSIFQDSGRAARALTDDDVLMGNIGLDSLDLAVMTVALEQRTGIDPFRTGRGAVRTFGELVAVYEEALAGSVK
jgi:acyl carrier protein